MQAALAEVERVQGSEGSSLASEGKHIGGSACADPVPGRQSRLLAQAYWCVGMSAAQKIRLPLTSVQLREIAWLGTPPGQATQLVVPTVGSAWFDNEELRERAIAKHGTPGSRCAACGTWRWMPLTFGALPPLRLDTNVVESDAIASPEWFGDGKQSFRQVLLRRDLAVLLASASPKDFMVKEVK